MGKLRASIIVFIVLVWTIGTYFAINGRPTPSLLASETYHDFGLVSPRPVSYTVRLSNVGESDLTILNIWTSCGCTYATISSNGVESPEFGTGGDAAFDTHWQSRLRPGASAELTIRYDPGITNGYFSGTKIVFVETNDPSQRVIQITVVVHEVP